MKRLIILCCLFISINTFGQDLIKKVNDDINLYSKYLKDCQDTYQHYLEKKQFKKPLSLEILHSMPADNTAVRIPIPGADQLQKLQSRYNKCDQELKSEAEANHVILPTIEDILELSPLPPINNSYDYWECWSGHYHPAIISIKKYDIHNNKDTFISLRSYEHNNQAFFGSSKKDEYDGLDNGDLKLERINEKSIKITVNTDGETHIYTCTPFKNQIVKTNDIKVHSGKGKTKSADGTKIKGGSTTTTDQ